MMFMLLLLSVHSPSHVLEYIDIEGTRLRHRVETYRDVTSVPTLFVRMLGKLLDACI